MLGVVLEQSTRAIEWTYQHTTFPAYSAFTSAPSYSRNRVQLTASGLALTSRSSLDNDFAGHPLWDMVAADVGIATGRAERVRKRAARRNIARPVRRVLRDNVVLVFTTATVMPDHHGSNPDRNAVGAEEVVSQVNVSAIGFGGGRRTRTPDCGRRRGRRRR